MHYVEHHGLLTDFRLIWQTILKIGGGALMSRTAEKEPRQL
jgi:hypothetical protein